MDVTRDVGGHINGYSGQSILFSTAPQIDGGLAFGPGGVLFFTGYPTNQLGQIEPGSVAPDKTIGLSGEGIASSVGTLAFVPAGFPGAGQLKIASYSASTWYTVGLAPDGGGTFDVDGVSASLFLGGSPEGIVYVEAGNPEFATQSVLISEFGTGRVSAYEIDANGDPVVGTRRTFVEDLTGAEGGVSDPLTGDFLFSTYGGGNQIIVVRGFTEVVPAPAAAPLLASALLALALVRRQR